MIKLKEKHTKNDRKRYNTKLNNKQTKKMLITGQPIMEKRKRNQKL